MNEAATNPNTDSAAARAARKWSGFAILAAEGPGIRP